MTALVIIGTGGHGREALDIVEAINARSPTFEFLGFIDDRRDNESLVTARGARILGPLETLRGIDARYVIGIGSGDIRRRLDRRGRRPHHHQRDVRATRAPQRERIREP